MRDDEDYKDDRLLSRDEAIQFMADIEYLEYLSLQEHCMRLEQWAAKALARKDKEIQRLRRKMERKGIDPDE